MDLKDFEYYKDVLARRSGLVINPDKIYLLESRLNPVARKWGYSDVLAMTRDLRQNNNEEMIVDIVEAMTTNETSFFRDLKPFQIMEEKVLPEMLEKRKHKKKLRIWCAACSSGQEPYSLAMTILETGYKFSDWNIEIIATDISRQILAQAERGVFSQFEVQRGLPVNYLMKYFEKDDERWKIKNDVKNMVEFKFLNLLEPVTGIGQFDIVFCRNVLIYFNDETKKQVLDRISGALVDDGYLFLGGAETVLGITDNFKLHPGKRGLYVKNASCSASSAGKLERQAKQR